MNFKRLEKIILFILFLWTIVIPGSICPAKAQTSMYGNVLATQSPMVLPFQTGKGVLVDNFEYWDSPRNHGWETYEPSYPVWGNGIGYGDLQTTLDFAQGSRVLDVHMPYSIFLPSNMMQLVIEKQIVDPVTATKGVKANLLWLSIRAPLEVEQFAMFKLEVMGTITQPTVPCVASVPIPFCIRFVPTGFNGCTDLEGVRPNQYALQGPENTLPNVHVVEFPLGRNFQDGTWHTIDVNLSDVIQKATTDYAATITDAANPITITTIRVFGNQYRLDNIWLLQDESPIEGEPPYFFKIGPQFIQIFDSFQYYCYAKDPDLSYRVYLDIWQNEYELTGVVPDHNYVRGLTDRFIRSQGGGHISDPTAIDPSRDRLFWTATVGAWGAHGSSANFLSEIPIANRDTNSDGIPDTCDPALLPPQLLMNPYKPCMVSLPTSYNPAAIAANPDLIAEYDPETVPHLKPGTGGARIYDPQAVAAYGNYLLNDLGFTTWPMVARIDYTPQVMEDVVMTVRVQDSHGRTDLETFPLSVVNYPVTNHAPKLENVDEQGVEVGKTYRYQMVATDQDWFSPDGSFTADQLNLTWSATIDGFSSYVYGPWSESIINPTTGEVTFTPEFEGIFHIIVHATDSRGLVATSEFDMLTTTPGSWLNHPPYIMGDFNDAAPLVIKAGQLFILGPPMLDFHDPDGDELYYSCNIGSVVVKKDEENVPRAYWTFQTNYPGFYWVQITAFDSRGGWTQSQFPIDVQPWWSI